jgi:hypothetical protein
VTAIKILTAIYFVGAGLFALTLFVVLLAFAGVRILPIGTDLAWPIIGSCVLMIGSKYAARWFFLRKDAQHG